jgi:hypothetical protein
MFRVLSSVAKCMISDAHLTWPNGQYTSTANTEEVYRWLVFSPDKIGVVTNTHASF